MAANEGVFEYLIDGISGISPGAVDGKVLVVGVCSKGTVGKGYLLGPKSDLDDLLGQGPLPDVIRDIFTTAGQGATLIAVPATGTEGGYITPIVQTGEGPAIIATGVAAENTDVILKITTGGALATAEYQMSEDGGDTWGDATVTPADGIVAVGTTGVNITMAAGTYVVDTEYEFLIRDSIGAITKMGTGPDITAAGTVKAAASVQMLIVKAGGLGVGRYRMSVDGGESYFPDRTIPADGVIAVSDTGVSITFPDSDAVLGDLYEFDLMPPTASITNIISAIETPLELYDVEMVCVVGDTDSTDWTALGVQADDQWNAHKPTMFICQSRLPYENEDQSDFVAEMIAERSGFAHRFVAVCTAYGPVTDSRGFSITRNWLGLLVGRLMSIPVMRSIGRVRDGGITPASLPEGFNNAVYEALEAEGFIHCKTEAGLESVYWGNARTMAEDTSDYRYIEILRVVFKAVRLLRIAALKSLHDEAGDTILGGDASGIKYLNANLVTALKVMSSAQPKELADYVIDIPLGQDIVNNGLSVETILIGIPIIRKIELHTGYTYSGSQFDPRITN